MARQVAVPNKKRQYTQYKVLFEEMQGKLEGFKDKYDELEGKLKSALHENNLLRQKIEQLQAVAVDLIVEKRRLPDVFPMNLPLLQEKEKEGSS